MAPQDYKFRPNPCGQPALQTPPQQGAQEVCIPVTAEKSPLTLRTPKVAHYKADERMLLSNTDPTDPSSFQDRPQLAPYHRGRTMLRAEGIRLLLPGLLLFQSAEEPLSDARVLSMPIGAWSTEMSMVLNRSL
ncbi:hypothetical protein H920_13980 [Fukomys damarensis]|uniref:Uncharacterized protein n=1 Tax=Fukomys damarensis TaxID=885580 RepID=A0A091D3B0_FUKDA|nr:hypothetical protein H920_13980 [Fukomys damarensis]